MIQKYIISLPPITKKNSQQILTNRRTGKPFIAPSRQYKKYEQAAMWYRKPRWRAAYHKNREKVLKRRRERRIAKNAEKPKKIVVPKEIKRIKPIEQCTSEADALGLTYGQYVARGLDKE